jgi:hypothetical protein
MMKERIRVIYLNLSLFCFLLVFIELIGQLAYYLSHGYPLFEREYRQASTDREHLFEPHPFLIGWPKKNFRLTQDGKTITTTDFHTRWTGAPANDEHLIRVALLGGSSTFGTGVTDRDSWPALLQEALGPRFAVLNYGVPNYDTAHAIIQMALLLPERRPHVIVLYQGWNDLRYYHQEDLGPDYFGAGHGHYKSLGLPVRFLTDREPLFSQLAHTSTICRFVDTLARSLFTRKAPPHSPESPTLLTPDPFVDRIFLRNLLTLRSLGTHFDALVLFVPQVLNLADFDGKGGSHPSFKRIERSSMRPLLDHFNAFMNDACPSGDTGCAVVSEVRSSSWQNTDFVDEGHFSLAGGRKFALLLANRIQHVAPVQ